MITESNVKRILFKDLNFNAPKIKKLDNFAKKLLIYNKKHNLISKNSVAKRTLLIGGPIYFPLFLGPQAPRWGPLAQKTKLSLFLLISFEDDLQRLLLFGSIFDVWVFLNWRLLTEGHGHI